ncbi:hypothetical protein K7472_31285 [Streptomyces sp. PTM05]|uniref:UmuC domain-containing protein n=1 Tax=Streptantibioticus parmotrematis TaxID=2873249 RepID=A0ABS7R5J5_9ACTN|nr:hypothetical protein [Streptantibioticus parmotrematis]MBY8889292.1 hypothetical protein [Streptantibioticus parmotrematis]
MTTPPARCVLRIRFHLPAGPTGEEIYERLLDLVADITARYQPHPPDTVDLDLTPALRYWAPRTPTEIAQLLRLRATALFGISSTAGLGASPMIATMALAGTPPGKLTAVAPGPAAVEAFLRPRPVAALPGVGPATAKALHRLGIDTVGRLADTPPATLNRILGTRPARQLHTRARGIDERPVQRTALVRSTTATHRFPHDELDPAVRRRALLGLAEELALRLRGHDEVCQSVTLTVHYADTTTTTRSRRLAEPTAHSPALRKTAYELHAAHALQRARVTALTLRADGLAPAAAAHHQLLLDPDDDKHHRLEQAADALRARYGADAIRPAALAEPPAPP